MLTVNRCTRDMVVNRDADGQQGRQLEQSLRFIHRFDLDADSPVLTERLAVGVDELAWRSWASRQDGVRCGVPPERIASWIGEQTPDLLG